MNRVSGAKDVNMKRRHVDPLSILLRTLTILAASITAGAILFIIGYIMVKGVVNLKPSLFEWTYTSENVSMMPSIINTILMLFSSLIIAAPLGIFSAIYLVEYAHRGSRLVKLVRMAAETLAGIPSIIYGLFGMLFFLVTCKFGYSLLAGACTLAIMVLPLIMRTSEEALLSVPDAYREGSFGLGAGRLRTVMRVVLPPAMPGILAGIILATGRIVGETAALIFTAGTKPEIPKSPMDSVRTLSVHMYSLSREGSHVNETYATAVVLIVMVLLVNALSGWLARRISSS